MVRFWDHQVKENVQSLVFTVNVHHYIGATQSAKIKKKYLPGFFLRYYPVRQKLGQNVKFCFQGYFSFSERILPNLDMWGNKFFVNVSPHAISQNQ